MFADIERSIRVKSSGSVDVRTATRVSLGEGVVAGILSPPGGSEDALGFGEGVSKGEMAFVGHEDGESNTDGHGHGYEGPEDPNCVVREKRSKLGDVIEWDRGCDGDCSY